MKKPNPVNVIAFVLSCIPLLIMFIVFAYSLFTGQLNSLIIITFLIFAAFSFAIFCPILSFIRHNKKEKAIQAAKIDTSYNREKDYPKNYIVFDLETTGLDRSTCQIIEIGAIKYENHIKTDVFHSYIKPIGKIPERITELTGITDEMVADAPEPTDVLEKLLPFLGDYVMIAHNSNYDMPILQRYYGEHLKKHLNNSVIDTLLLARIYLDELNNHKLPTIKKHFDLSFGSHNALDDCETAAFLYKYCFDKHFAK